MSRESGCRDERRRRHRAFESPRQFGCRGVLQYTPTAERFVIFYSLTSGFYFLTSDFYSLTSDFRLLALDSRLMTPASWPWTRGIGLFGSSVGGKPRRKDGQYLLQVL